jgi:hypothetical protein
VTLFGRDAKILARIPERGTGYQLRRPADVAFDRLGHVYILDRGSVFVFAIQGPRLITTFTIPEKGTGAVGTPQALAVDSAARLYIFDEKSNMVQVFR